MILGAATWGLVYVADRQWSSWWYVPAFLLAYLVYGFVSEAADMLLGGE